jgi:hypothetical protein
LAARIPPRFMLRTKLRAHILAHRNTSKIALFFAAVGDEYARRERSLFLELAVSCGDRQGKARVEGRSELGPALLNRGAASTRELEMRMLPYCWPRVQGVTGEGLGCARKKGWHPKEQQRQPKPILMRGALIARERSRARYTGNCGASMTRPRSSKLVTLLPLSPVAAISTRATSPRWCIGDRC